MWQESHQTYRDDTKNPPKSKIEVGMKHYETTLEIKVSEKDSENILKQYVDDSRTVIINTFGNDVISRAMLFQKRVILKHNDVLQKIFDKINSSIWPDRIIIDTFGFSSNFNRILNLNDVNMQNLSFVHEELGLIMAVCENARDNIPKDQLWIVVYIEDKADGINHRVGLDKISEKEYKIHELKEW